MAAHGLFSNYLLFFSGLVFMDASNKFAFVQRLNYFLLSHINFQYVSIFGTLIILLVLGIAVLERRVSIRIHML